MIDKNEIQGAAKLVTNPQNEYWEIRLCHDSEPIGPLVCIIHRNYLDLSDVDPLLENPEVPLRAHPCQFITAFVANEDLEQYLFSYIRQFPEDTFELSVFMMPCGDGMHEMDKEMRHVFYDPIMSPKDSNWLINTMGG